MLKLAAILGSPREGGNTDILLNKLIEGAKTKGVAASKIILNRYNIKPCQNCGGCQKTGRCIINDDMAFIYKAIDQAHYVVIGSPIYFGNVSAQTKIMVDRMQCRWVKKYILKSGNTEKREGAFISCGGFEKTNFFECAKKVIDIFFRVNNIEFKYEFFKGGVERKGDIARYPDALESAYKIGSSFTK